MYYTVNRCAKLHVGRHNVENSYTLDGTEIHMLNSEKDLGVIVSNDSRPKEQCISAANRANWVLGLIKMEVSKRTRVVILELVVM